MRQGLGAYHDDQHVLKLDPKYEDAKLVVGTFQYIIGSLTWWEKSLVFVADMRGNKAKGLALLRQVVEGDGGRASTRARSLRCFWPAIVITTRRLRCSAEITRVSRTTSFLASP